MLYLVIYILNENALVVMALLTDIHLYRQEYYEVYFKNLGVQNIYIFPEDFCDIDPKDPRLQGVVLVMACPPCSNSSILDPVDLSISRGGDIKLLKDLTNKAEDICNEDDTILTKQRTTLQRALSIPQVIIDFISLTSQF